MIRRILLTSAAALAITAGAAGVASAQPAPIQLPPPFPASDCYPGPPGTLLCYPHAGGFFILGSTNGVLPLPPGFI
ncbi:hypothetical protein [Millisia brevis]|uniref:hypothetical protein n=1 Tax=Millisia brevis TaxID=264148 RepID=UPI0012ED8D00|nr:hypothetical protein [Millisia brevis]